VQASRFAENLVGNHTFCQRLRGSVATPRFPYRISAGVDRPPSRTVAVLHLAPPALPHAP
jgi:hypothetical protein